MKNYAAVIALSLGSFVFPSTSMGEVADAGTEEAVMEPDVVTSEEVFRLPHGAAVEGELLTVRLEILETTEYGPLGLLLVTPSGETVSTTAFYPAPLKGDIVDAVFPPLRPVEGCVSLKGLSLRLVPADTAESRSGRDSARVLSIKSGSASR